MLLSRLRSLVLFAFVIASCHSMVAQESPFKKGDHVVYIGNTLADRMQHHGWLESYIHALHPNHDLTFRNLGFSGDEIALRQRADNFGDPDQWLTKCEADVIACFFGYNESLKGSAGLAQFAKDLTENLGHMQRQHYNGSSPPRIIVFSPIAHENLMSPHLPDGSANNQNLQLYTEAMRKVCQAAEVPFIDLFSISSRLYAESDQPLTMNGIHLLDHGNRALARAIIKTVAPNAQLPTDEQIAKLREAVLDKNYHWFSRYRVVDEYNVFGGRSKLSWFGQSNADVMMREMEIFDVKTANRDQRIWAVAKGDDLVVTDDNLPEEVAVRPNREGPLEGGAFPYLDGEEAIASMTVGSGLAVNLFASEKQFPRLINPVQMAVDPDSRLWVSVWPSYPHWNPTQPRQDALVILPDEDGDGKADDLIVFADELNSITGFEFWGGGVLVAAPPEIWFLKDTNGDDKADVKIRVLQGLSSADTHHSANAMVIGPDGWLYWSRGIFNVAAFETPTKTYRSGLSGVHRFNPRTFETEFHYPIGPNPHGDVFDRWGFQFANDGTSGTGGYVSIGKGQRPGNRQWFKKEWRPVAATGILSSEHFPDRFQNNFLICNTIGFLGVLRYEVKYDGAQIIAERTEDLIQSSDPNFRPSDIEVGGDGAIYISDWHNTLIGHMQHNMRDPNRDHLHGRIYRVTAVGSAPARPVKMVDQPVEEVLSHFFSKTNSVRYRARLELSGRDSGETIEAVTRFAAGLNPARVESDRDEAQALLECLWVHEEHRVPNVPLVKKTYQVAEPRVRAAAIRTLGHWAEHNVPEWEPILAMAAQDQSPLVRAEAVKAAVNFAGLAATEVIFEVATRDTDDELNDVLEFARNQIDVDKMIAESIAAQRPLSPAAKRYALSNADAELLLKMERSPEVFQALVARANIEPEIRWQAIDHVFQGAGQQRVQRILAAIQTAERSHFDSFNELASLLSTLDTSELENAGSVLKQLVESTQSADARQAAYAAWFRAGQSQAAQAWAHAITSRVLLNDALVGIESIGDKNSLASVFDRVRPLMFELPQHLQTTQDQAESAGGPAVSFEYYEPNPRNVAVETLDKIKPQLIGSIDNFNVYVPKGRHDEFATRQTAYLLVPEGGRYSFYTNSDDGSRLYIDGRLVVDNDGDHGMVEKSGRIRLDAGQHKIVVTYCDSGGGDGLVVSWRGPGIEKQPIPTSALRSTGGGNLRQRALEVIARWPGHTQEKIRDFAALTTDDSLAISALEALANQPVASVASQIQGDNSRRLLASIVARADLATPVEKQEDVYARMLTLGESLLASDAGDNSLARKIRDLRASIPVKADPRVMSLGAEVYARESHCATCHQPHGQGLPNLYPPLDGSLWATGSQERLIHLVLDGMHGTIEVKGKRYSSPPLPPMTGFRHLLNDEEIAAVVTYVRNSWTNRAAPIDAAAVASVRATNRDGDAVFWGANELLKLYPLEDGSQPIDQGPSDGWIPKLVKEWQVKDFSPADLAISGRSHADGALWFNRIGCAQCHTLGGKGGVFGPNLAELEPKKQSAAAILESILDPSKDIDPKFAMKNYLLESGNVISGFVVMETPTEIHLKSDPLSPDKSVIVSKDEIEEASTSTKSVMPQGLLNWLTKQQILDLLAYVHSGGDENHSVYQE